MTTMSKPPFEAIIPPKQTTFSPTAALLSKSAVNLDTFSIGIRLLSDDLLTVFPPELIGIFDELRTTTIFWETCVQDDCDVTPDDVQHFSLKTHGMTQRLLDLPYRVDPRFKASTIAEGCRVATLAYVKTALRYFDVVWRFQGPIQALLRILKDDEVLLAAHWAPFTDLLLWVLFMGMKFLSQC
jgi:hypothetical protein